MSEEDQSESGNAATPIATATSNHSVTSRSASWNPALRPDSDSEHVQQNIIVSDRTMLQHDTTFSAERGAISSLETGAQEEGQNDSIDLASSAHRDSIIHQGSTIEEPRASHLDEAVSSNAPKLSRSGLELEHDQDETQKPESGYEHQGETLAMEEAVDEAPEAPLLMDPEEPPTVDPLPLESTTAAFQEKSASNSKNHSGLGPDSLDSEKQPGNLNRSFTTNFTDVPPHSDVQENAEQMQVSHVGQDWPAVGDDKTFGELLGDELAMEQLEVRSAEEAPSPPADDDEDGWGISNVQDDFGELLGNDQTAMIEGTSMDIIKPQGADGTTLSETLTTTAEPDKDSDLAAMWQAALDDDDLLDESNDLDPSTFFGDDDPGFLLDDEPEPATLQTATSTSNQLTSVSSQRTSSYTPATASAAARQAPQGNSYATPGPQILSQNHSRSAGTPSTGLDDIYGYNAPQQTQQTQRPTARSSGSFVDKAKGGYQSPYDLPMDVVKTKQRPRPAAVAPQSTNLPPPRVASMLASSGQSPHGVPIAPSLTPPSSSGSSVPAPQPPTAVIGTISAKPTPKSDNGFFADLPIAPKSRNRLSGAYTPQNQALPASLPGPLPLQPLNRGSETAPVQPPPRPSAPPTPAQQPMYGGLTRQQDSLPLLPDEPTALVQPHGLVMPPTHQRYSPSNLQTSVQTQNRFSPAPPAQTTPATSRYSPAPGAQVSQPKRYASTTATAPTPAGVQTAHPFAPRTSSPLAFQTDRQNAPLPGSPPKVNGFGLSGPISPERTASLNHSPINQRSASATSIPSSPRPQTQSPSGVSKVARYSMQSLDMSTLEKPVPAPSQSQSTRLTHRRQFSRDMAFAPPSEELNHDPLQRWKGAPVFRWNESGVIVSSFPKQIPFYGSGGAPTIKCTPGTVSSQQATIFMPMDEINSKFPGPLTVRAKGKKKDVLAWMTGKIADLEQRVEVARSDFQIEIDLKNRTEERLVLWRIVKIFVEHDGHLEGDKKIEEEVRAVLLPDLAQMSQVMQLQSPHPITPGVPGDAVDRSAIFQLRQALLEGQRERAVWLAEEKKLWGHAMLIASTMGPEVWKQIIQSFVRSQVKTVGSDARSLAALYQVFAGNSEECVDELVPLSARAGFPMISKSEGTTPGNPLEGLDQWRETLGLIAGNRTPVDGHSLLSLGKLLGSYGRAEAAHTCYLFTRSLAKFAGADEADVNFVILGADHTSKVDSFANDLDAIILTEIYEWASSLSAQNSTIHYIPHLQSFKLRHAQELSAFGLKSKAQAYCDHITSAYTSTTRPSPYYHSTFTQSVSDLSATLSQTPNSGSSGLMSKGAMNKVSTGAASWFTKFVSGDDDQGSTGSGPGARSEDMMTGPFGRVNGDSPDISRTASSSDLYNSMAGARPYTPSAAIGTPFGGSPPQHQNQQFAPTSAPSKYAPMAVPNKYAPLSSSGVNAAAQRSASPQHHRPGSSRSSRSYAPISAAQALGVPRPDSNRAASDYDIPYASDSRPSSAQYLGSQAGFESGALPAEVPAVSYPGTDSERTSEGFGDQTQVLSGLADGRAYDEAGSGAENGGYQASDVGYEPHNGSIEPESGGYKPSNEDYEPVGGSYEPPTSGYEPPSYQPYEPDPEPEESVPKKMGKSFMDNDDDDDTFIKSAAATQKAEADRQADDAFRKAAEADAEREKGGSHKRSSWLPSVGGWFGGAKKDAEMPTVHRAKLGEENSFYYDENLKKWVNKKGGAEAATPAAATPPPPMGPPSRGPSGGMGPPSSGPPSRVVSGNGPPGMGVRPAHSLSGSVTGSPSMGPTSGPPSRIGTPASSDLPFPAAVSALNGGGPHSAPSRPATGMSNASSLDDLLGGPVGPGQRKAGGTVKSKKKGGRYVDVMQAK